MKKKNAFSVGLLVAIFHFFLQGFSWSFFPGNTAFPHECSYFSIFWKVFSFPLFYLLPKDGNNFFATLAFVSNSVTWGMVGVYITYLFHKKYRRTMLKSKE